MNAFVVTATRSMKSYASKVAEYLSKIPRFSNISDSFRNGVDIMTVDRFADGEIEVSIEESVRGKDIILFTNCSENEAGIGVNEAKIELYHTIDALKRSQARDIFVFEPFISCSRSDRTTRRNSVGLWVHFKTLACLGVKHIVTYQLHSNKSEAMLDPTICALDDMPTLNLMKRYLCDTYIRDIKTLEEDVRPNWAFCSVDAGGEKIAREFANAFLAPLVVAYKQRDYSRYNAVESVNILSSMPIEGKVIWIVDDMIDTGGSIEELIRTLEDLKPKEINIAVVHAVFSPPAAKRLNSLWERGLLNRVIVGDTVSTSAFSEMNRRIEVVPSTEFSAKIVHGLITNQPMGKLKQPFNAEKYLKSPNLFNVEM